MKVLLVNGSPHQFGCTYTALKEVSDTLNAEGIETVIYWIKNGPIYSCMDCDYCRSHEGKCVRDDAANEINEIGKDCDGLIIGTAVHYASASGAITAVMDRVFHSNSKQWKYKPGAAVVSCRRSGSTATFEQLNKYFTINCMPVVSSQYWNAVHGNTPEEVKQDKEGLQTMRTLAHNMAWLLKCIELGKNNGLNPVKETGKEYTNFIR